MATTNYVTGTVISADWLNDVDEATYNTLPTQITDHIADPIASHAASSISIADAGGLLTATEVEAALAEIQTNINNHTSDTTDAHAASSISIADSGGLYTATEVEGALQEMYNRLPTTTASYDGIISTGTSWTKGLAPCALVAEVNSTALVTTHSITPATNDIATLGKSWKITLQDVTFGTSEVLSLQFMDNSGAGWVAVTSSVYRYSYLADLTKITQTAYTTHMNLFPSTSASISGEIRVNNMNSGISVVSWNLMDASGTMTTGTGYYYGSTEPRAVRLFSVTGVNFFAFYAKLLGNC